MPIHYTYGSGLIDQNPPSQSPMLLGVAYSTTLLASMIVAMRITAKAKLGKLAVEDLFIVLSTLSIIGLLVVVHWMVPYGLGRHVTEIEPEWWPTIGKLGYASVVICVVPYPLTKISILCFYFHLTPQPIFRKICLTLIGSFVVSSVVLVFVTIFSCSPVRGGWDHDPALHPKCIDDVPFLLTSNIMNIITDIVLMAMPIPVLLKLQLRPGVKYGLVSMFAAGILITAISFYLLHVTIRVYHSSDILWDGAFNMMLTFVEFNLGIITASMPSMLLFIKWVRGEMTETKGSEGRSRNENLTIGSGGGNGSAKFNRSRGPSEMDSRMSHRLGSEEYIMQDTSSIIKSTEVVVVVEMRVPQRSKGDDGGSLC